MRALRVDGWVVAIFLVAAAAHPWPAAAVTCGSLAPTQSSSHAVVSGNSGACVDAMTGFTRENSYYRAFQPLAGPFSVCAVEIGVELAQAGGGGSQPLTANLYTNAGAPFPGRSRSCAMLPGRRPWPPATPTSPPASPARRWWATCWRWAAEDGADDLL